MKDLKVLAVLKVSLFCSIMILPFQGYAAPPDSLIYTDASKFQLLGKGFPDTETYYERLPASYKDKTRPPVWELSKNCSGMAVRFRTNSRVISVKWEVKEDVFMNHFAPTGIKGLDMYCLKNGEWQFVNTGRPTGKASSAVLISGMQGNDDEYLLNLPLYDGLVSLEIGVEQTARIGKPQVNSPRKGKPVVFYGTSITQGGCASRPGMAYTNILSRMLDRETINLGFSGNGRLDLEIAEAMSTIDASCFVIDCLPNCTADLVNEKYKRFLEIIRQKHPETPILLVENIENTRMYFNQSGFTDIQEKNLLLKGIFKDLIQNGDRNIYYMEADKLVAGDHEGTVDGIHLTDLGFWRLSQNMYPVIRDLIR